MYQRLQCRDKYFFKIKFVFFLSFFLCGCQHHQRETICLYVYISDIRQLVGYRTPVFIQRFPLHLHITITYNLPHLRLWYADVVTVLSNSVNTADLFRRQDKKKTERGRNWHDSNIKLTCQDDFSKGSSETKLSTGI